ncbi:MAG: tRNA(Ile)(2)-agmatinylcytidine synthase [Candidatus Bathyarchaeia archaeon]
MEQICHIGIDDTDSPRMGCTTYIAALLVEKLEEIGCIFIDYPNLIRLNPNVPWKTRGNGAVALRFKCLNHKLEEVYSIVLKIVEENSDLKYPKTDPAIAFLKGEVPEMLSLFAKKAIQNVLSIKEAEKTAELCNVKVSLIKGNRGIVGALAALGETLQNDYTYELIAYRTIENRGVKKRRVSEESVKKMDALTKPLTFNNYDYEKKRVLITPRGKDPILCGVRGETPSIVLKAFKMLEIHEEVERWVIFRTNQGTDMHLRRVNSISEVSPYQPVIVLGKVASQPKTIPGAHVIFKLNDDTGEIDCAAYEPTGKFRNIVRKLIPGDLIEAAGGVRQPTKNYGRTINLEKIKILKLTEKNIYLNPICKNCGKRMESSGRNQDFRCRKCGFKASKKEKIKIKVDRDLKEGLYMPPPRAHRHLTKPELRYGREKHGELFKLLEKWHEP